jgi:DNA-binding transcriptional LysR family regulator
MNITQLRAFAAVVDTGSFSEAARLTGVSQPAVTMQIKSLETEVGATLLDRRYRGVSLTEAGDALLPHARRILEDLARARDDIEALSDTLTGRLVIATSTTPGDYVVPKVLGEFLRANPQVQVEVTVQDTAETIVMVEDGTADLGVCGSKPSSRVESEEIGSDRLVVICPPEHPLATRASVPVAELADADWVGREPGSGTASVVREVLAQNGIDPDRLRVVVEFGTGEAVVSAVEGGIGVAMVSDFVAHNALGLGLVRQVDLAEGPFTRPFYLALPKATRTRAAIAFADYLRAALASTPGAAG